MKNATGVALAAIIVLALSGYWVWDLKGAILLPIVVFAGQLIWSRIKQ
jgi:hypothetical protein